VSTEQVKSQEAARERRVKRIGSAVLLLLSLVAAPRAFAGATGGPRTGTYNLAPGKDVTWTIAYDGGSFAAAWFQQKQKSKVLLEIEVADIDSSYVCSSIGDGSLLGVAWWAPRNGVYTVTVYNDSKSGSAAITLGTN
jgi:hypothetical protein